jgi:N-acetylglucosaminyl-diphospho-decaprenol L-rhamnosyltransferase
VTAAVPPRVSIVLVSFNTRAKLLSALDALAVEAADGTAPPFEVVVVDNASTDGSAAAAAAHALRPVVRRRAANDGFAAGVNEGVAAARGDVIVLLNSDARPEPGALARLVDYLAANPVVGVVGARVTNPDGSRQPTAFREPTAFATFLEFGLFRPVAPAPDVTGPVDWVSGALMAFPRSLARDVGGFDDGYFLYAEDIDWCRRVRASGREVHYLAEPGAVHEARGSDPEARNWSPRAVAARLRFHAKHGGPAAALLTRAALSAAWLAALLVALPAALLPGRSGRRARRAAGTLAHLLLTAGDSRPKPIRVAMIAIVDFPNGVGGDTRRVHMLARSLVTAGLETTLLIPLQRGLVVDAHTTRRSEVIDGIRVERLSTRGSYGHAPGLGGAGFARLFLLRWWALAKTLLALVRLRRAGVNRFYLYQPTFYDGAAVWLLARLTGAKTAADYCDLTFVDHDRIERNPARRLWALNYRLGMSWLPARLDVVFVISRYLEEMMARDVPRGRLVRIPPVVDADAFDVDPPEAAFRASGGIPAGRVVLYAGSFFDNEGVPTLLAAAPDILARRPDAHIVIVGGHPAEALEELKRSAASLDVSDRVHFPGVRPSLDMPRWFRAADVLVAPKADHVLNRAGVPTKLVEYLASGRPVVASAVGDIPDLVADRVEALLVPPGRPDALAAAVGELLDDPDLARRLGEAGRHAVRRRHDTLAVGQVLRRSLEAAGQADPDSRSGGPARSAGRRKTPE